MNQQAEPWQEELKPGDYIVRLTQQGGYLLPVLAQLIDPLAYYDGKDLSDPATREDYEWEKSLNTDELLKLCRYSRCFSSLSLNPSYGYTPVALVTMKITREAFVEARSQRWNVDLSWLDSLRERGMILAESKPRHFVLTPETLEALRACLKSATEKGETKITFRGAEMDAGYATACIEYADLTFGAMKATDERNGALN